MNGLGQPTSAAFAGVSQVAKVAFVSLCGERLLPFYDRFEGAALDPVSDPLAPDPVPSGRQLRRALDLGWAFVDGAAAQSIDYGSTADALDDDAPDADEFHSEYASTALDAWLVAGLAVRLCGVDDESMAAEAAELAAEAAFAEAQRTDSRAGLGELLAGPRVRAEIDVQMSSLDFLVSVSKPQPGLSDSLRRRFAMPTEMPDDAHFS